MLCTNFTKADSLFGKTKAINLILICKKIKWCRSKMYLIIFALVLSYFRWLSRPFSSPPRIEFCVRGEVRHAAAQRGPVWAHEADESGGGPGPLAQLQPPSTPRAPAREQPARRQHRHALPHRPGHRRQQVRHETYISRHEG